MAMDGKAPPGMYAMGDKAGRQRMQQAINDFCEEHGITPMEFGMLKYSTQANRKALDDITKREVNTRNIQEKIIKHGDLAIQLAETGGGTTNFKLLNSAQIAAKAQSGDAAAQSYLTQFYLLQQEIAKLSSPGSNAMLAEGARQEAEKVMNPGFTHDQLPEVMRVIKRDAEISHETFTKMRTEVVHRMLDDADRHATSPANHGATASYDDPEKEARYQKWKAENGK
jgi:hypothetical protein